MQVLLSVTHKKYSKIASLDKNVSMQVPHSPPLEVKKNDITKNWYIKTITNTVTLTWDCFPYITFLKCKINVNFEMDYNTTEEIIVMLLSWDIKICSGTSESNTLYTAFP